MDINLCKIGMDWISLCGGSLITSFTMKHAGFPQKAVENVTIVTMVCGVIGIACLFGAMPIEP